MHAAFGGVHRVDQRDKSTGYDGPIFVYQGILDTILGNIGQRMSNQQTIDVSRDALFPDGREDDGGWLGAKGFVRVHPGHGALDCSCIETAGERMRVRQRGEGRYFGVLE